MKICPFCCAPNRHDAAWCGRCQERFAGEPKSAPTVSPAVAEVKFSPVPRLPSSDWIRLLRKHATSLAVVVLLLTRVLFDLTPFGGQEMAEAGRLDPGGFRFLSVEAGTTDPVRYNACQPVHYVINPALAPPSAIDDVHRAMKMTGDASGIRFVFDGMTDETGGTNRALYQPGRYGERWAPILIGWSPGIPSDEGMAAQGLSVVGQAGSVYRNNEQGHPVYVTGMAVFDANADLNSGFGGETWGQVMLHEFAHVVGLDHVTDPTSVMNPVMGMRAATWGPGDRDGLWALGLGESCLSTPELP
jgi:hypothetical protein